MYEDVEMLIVGVVPVTVDVKMQNLLITEELISQIIWECSREVHKTLLNFFCTSLPFSVDYENDLYSLNSCHGVIGSDSYDKIIALQMKPATI